MRATGWRSMIIETEGLRKNYGATVALDGVDLSIEGGGIVGLLGPNGAGKTTLVEILEGLRLPTAGRTSVLGFDPTRQARELKERIGAQLQSTTIPAELTVAEVLRLYAAFYQRSRSIEEVLEQVNLEAKAKALIRTLSGGQKQRLAIGMALIHEPELLIFDEPTSGLDPAARRQLHRIVLDLKSRGRTIILTTHYIEEAEKLCDRVIMIRAGEIVADGSPFELVGHAGGKSTIWIDVDGPLDVTPLLEVGAKAQGRQGAHYRFTTSDPTATILALGDLLRSQKVTLRDLRLRRPTLEDVYLELMGDSEAGEEAGDKEDLTIEAAGQEEDREAADATGQSMGEVIP
ncbi:MAG: ABC transporter ATP-binding protein [Acidobacteriota bacterium]